LVDEGGGGGFYIKLTSPLHLRDNAGGYCIPGAERQ
jgi:hypothetical protein